MLTIFFRVQFFRVYKFFGCQKNRFGYGIWPFNESSTGAEYKGQRQSRTANWQIGWLIGGNFVVAQRIVRKTQQLLFRNPQRSIEKRLAYPALLIGKLENKLDSTINLFGEMEFKNKQLQKLFCRTHKFLLGT